MGIQIVSLFPKECLEADEPIDAEIDAEIDERLTLVEMLHICGHKALGFSEREAIEIDENYKYDLMHEYYYR